MPKPQNLTCRRDVWAALSSSVSSSWLQVIPYEREIAYSASAVSVSWVSIRWAGTFRLPVKLFPYNTYLKEVGTMPLISAVTHVFPDHYYPQEILLGALREHWTKTHSNLDRLERIHRNVGVNGRHLALPMEEYEGLQGWEAKNN